MGEFDLSGNKTSNNTHTFLPHIEKAILPPSSSPAGMLLMAFMRSPAQAHITRGFTDMGVPSLRASPKSSFAEKWKG